MRASWALLALVACDPVARGDAAWDEGRTADAVAAWRSAEDLDPAHRGRLARALVRLGDLEAAAQTLDGLPADQRTAEGHLASGLLLLHLGDTAAAVAAFEVGLAIEPLPALLVNQCTALGELGAPSARATCQEAIEGAPELAEPYLGLAAASADDLPDAAREAMALAIARAGPRGSAERTALAPWIGEVWGRLGEQEAACSWGLEGGQGDLGTARACVASGRVQEARPLLEALADGPDPLVPLRVLFQLELDRAERSDPGPAREHALGGAERWRLRLAPAMAERGGDAGWRTDLGRQAWLEERFGEAEAHWTAAVSAAPAEAAPRLNLARSLDRRGRAGEARALLEAATEAGVRGPGLHAVQLALAGLELEAGEAEVATRRLTGVHNGCVGAGLPACAAQAAHLLARLEAEAGQHDAALAHLEQALAFGGAALREEVARDAAFASLEDDLRFRQLTASP